ISSFPKHDRPLSEPPPQLDRYVSSNPEDEQTRLGRPFPVVADALAAKEPKPGRPDNAFEFGPAPAVLLLARSDRSAIERRHVGPRLHAVTDEKPIELRTALSDPETETPPGNIREKRRPLIGPDPPFVYSDPRRVLNLRGDRDQVRQQPEADSAVGPA